MAPEVNLIFSDLLPLGYSLLRVYVVKAFWTNWFDDVHLTCNKYRQVLHSQDAQHDDL